MVITCQVRLAQVDTIVLHNVAVLNLLNKEVRKNVTAFAFYADPFFSLCPSDSAFF